MRSARAWIAATLLVACSAKDTAPVPLAPATLAPGVSAEAGTLAASASVATMTAPSTSAMAAPSATVTPPPGSSTSASSAAAHTASDGMVVVPEGTFRMGGIGLEDSPIHLVAVARFELDKTEVTMDAYGACMAERKCEAPKDDNPFCNVKLENRGRHPVNCVDYRDAKAYCTFARKRLPSEREWEYAARGGSEQRTFSWGEELPDTKRACYMHEGGSCQVASFAPGAFGLYDMSGNVWEWTSSWFAGYPEEPVVGLFKVYRGGSWSRRFPKWLHNELRNRYRPDEHSASLGIRCAKSVIPLVCSSDAEARGDVCAPKGSPTLAPAAPCGPASANVNLPCPATRLPAVALKPRESEGFDAEPLPAKPDPPIRVRSAEFDGDCGHYPGYPVSFTWRGGTFQAREPLVGSSGCKKRDIGVGWTSTCCPQ